jgi:hypothetical protein
MAVIVLENPKNLGNIINKFITFICVSNLKTNYV